MPAGIRREARRAIRARRGAAWPSPSRDSQQRAVAAEAGAERRHPPPTAGGTLLECALQDKEHEGAAQVAELAQHCAAPAQVFRVELEPRFELGGHLAP